MRSLDPYSLMKMDVELYGESFSGFGGSNVQKKTKPVHEMNEIEKLEKQIDDLNTEIHRLRNPTYESPIEFFADDKHLSEEYIRGIKIDAENNRRLARFLESKKAAKEKVLEKNFSWSNKERKNVNEKLLHLKNFVLKFSKK